MIIVLSGWRGLDRRTAQRNAFQASQALIDEACSEVMGVLMRAFPGAHYRVGDANGIDAGFRKLFATPKAQAALRRAGGSCREFKADWDLLPKGSGGPERNHRMLDGEGEHKGTLHEELGIAHQLVAIPEVGEPKVKSGTWGCVKAAHTRYIPALVLPLGLRPEYAAAGLRRTRTPLLTAQLTVALAVAR